jgi:iron complex transport system substrate-binding protein
MKKTILILVVVFAISLSFALTVVDDSFTTVKIDKVPQRVISAAPAITEMLFYMGFGNKVVGVTNYDNYPAEVSKIKKIGQMSPLNIEAIASLKPDLIFAFGGFQMGDVAKLRKYNYKVVVVNPKTIEDIVKDMVMISAVMGDDSKSSKVISLYNKVIDTAKKASTIEYFKRPKVLVGSNYEPMYVPCEGSFLNEAIAYAGGRNISSDLIGANGWTPVNNEFIISKNPNVVLIPSYGAMKSDSVKFMNNKHWKILSAVRNKRVYAINSDILYRPGPRLLEFIPKLYSILFGSDKN